MTKYDNIPGFPGYYISKRGGLWSNRKNGQWAMGMDKATNGVTVIIK